MPIQGVAKAISQAKSSFADYGSEMLADDFLQKLIDEYRQAIENTNRLMKKLNLVALCSNCAAREHGSCCSDEVENWYDSWLLFINLLMGAEIDLVREAPGQCLFVGAHGCKLIARFSFCVNFLCPEIVQSLTESDKRKLLAVSGAELLAGWNLEQELRKWIRDKST